MRKRRIATALCGILMLGFILAGCVSEEAQTVIDGIDALGEISLDSFQELQALNVQYNALSEEDKADVSNADLLVEANTKYNVLKYEDLDSRINAACQNVTSDSLSTLENLLAEYEQLSEEGKQHISSVSSLENAISESQSLLAEEITAGIIDDANGAMSTAKSNLNEYHDIMTDDQIEDCLIEIGRWGTVSEAEDYLKGYLKSPNSYIRYSGKCSVPELQDDGTYKVQVYLDYGADNSFGASVRDEVELYVYFRVDIESLAVRFTETELTAYYKWTFASS